PLIGNEFLPLCPQGHVFSGLFIEPAPLLAVEHRLSDNSRYYARPEVVLAIEMLDGFHHFGAGQAGVFEMRKLMPTLIGHLNVGPQESVSFAVVVQFGTGIGVGDGNLDRLAVKFLREFHRGLDSFRGLARQPDDEISMNDNARFLAVLHELSRLLNGGPLLDVLEDLRIAGFEPYDKEPAPGRAHRFQRLEVNVDP